VRKLLVFLLLLACGPVGFDPIGKSRGKDLAGRPVDNVVRLPSGGEARSFSTVDDPRSPNALAESFENLATPAGHYPI